MQFAPPAQAFHNAVTLYRQGRVADAERQCLQILAADNDALNARYLLAVIYSAHSRMAEALGLIEPVVHANPDSAEILANYAAILRGLSRPKDAIAAVDRALAIEPKFAPALRVRGKILFDLNRVGEGLEVYRKAALLARKAPDAAERKRAAPPHKARHDLQQQRYLAERPQGRSQDRPGGLLTAPAVNRDLDREGISAQWRSVRPQIVVIDDILSPRAFGELRRYCLSAPVWNSAQYGNGYLGAFLDDGFACPLLGQIADELPRALPTVFASHTLLNLWGFKYDSQPEGIEIHADEAAVNVNFWLTPDSANLDPATGGLIIWDVAAPLDWNFEKFNRDIPAIREHLKRSGAKPTRVPYKANRAVIFDSDLFHETDTIHFKEGYENRRINVTLLYGRREAASPDRGA